MGRLDFLLELIALAAGEVNHGFGTHMEGLLVAHWVPRQGTWPAFTPTASDIRSSAVWWPHFLVDGQCHLYPLCPWYRHTSWPLGLGFCGHLFIYISARHSPEFLLFLDLGKTCPQTGTRLSHRWVVSYFKHACVLSSVFIFVNWSIGVLWLNPLWWSNCEI